MSGNNQIEMPLPVAVCAWCKPHERGSGIGSVSHGICLRHLRKFKLEVQGMNIKKTPRARKAKTKHEALLPL